MHSFIAICGEKALLFRSRKVSLGCDVHGVEYCQGKH